MLSTGLKKAAIPYRLVRRRSSPREEPRVRAWLTWLALAHPEWEVRPSIFDVAEALDLSISGLDPARAHLVAESLYSEDAGILRSVDNMDDVMLQRIGPIRSSLVEDLRLWLKENGHGELTIDRFLSLLFNELLAQPRYQPKPDLVGAAICDWLVRSARRLRWAAEPMDLKTPEVVGAMFIDSIYQGLVSASPPDMGDPPDPVGVSISTMYGFLLSGSPVRWQVWLDIGANGWWDIPNQPLSNAFVLTKKWPEGQMWTMADDFAIRNELLSRIIQGLVRRCTMGIVLANSDLDRRGFRQDGALAKALEHRPFDSSIVQ